MFKGGIPEIRIRLVEGQTEIVFRPRGSMTTDAFKAEAHTLWRVKSLRSEPAVTSFQIQLGDHASSDPINLKEEADVWKERGIPTVAVTIGMKFSLGDQFADSRRTLLLGAHHFPRSGRISPTAEAEQQRLLRTYGLRTSLFETIEHPSKGSMQLLNEAGNPVMTRDAAMEIDIADAAGFELGTGQKAYRGNLEISFDQKGQLVAVNRLSIEDLLKGLVPSEMYASAPAEALKAQAVSARGEMLATIGTRHLGDPYSLCSEQHCAVYRGLLGEAASTTQAVDDTRGQMLFNSEGKLIHSVYSAVCGGHTENNEAAWDEPADPALRGVTDVLAKNQQDLPDEAVTDLADFVRDSHYPAACQPSRFSSSQRFRWERTFTQAEVNQLTSSFHIGDTQIISVAQRGASGRATLLTLAGTLGATQVKGELTIRKLFKMLNSSLFEVQPQRNAQGHLTAWNFTGAGWGHGVGMCQTGAIGRAQAGQTYVDILSHYFTGSTIARGY